MSEKFNNTKCEKDLLSGSQSNVQNHNQNSKGASIVKIESCRLRDQNEPAAKVSKREQGVSQIVVSNQFEQKPDPAVDFSFKIGDMLNQKYKITRQLGTGSYAMVYMTIDTLNQNRAVAIKVGKSGTVFDISLKKERDFMKVIRDRSARNIGAKQFVKLLGSFDETGTVGTHSCLVLEMLGPTLEANLRNSDIPLLETNYIRSFCRQLSNGLRYLHDVCGIIHCDLKPLNIMVKISEHDIKKMIRNSSYQALGLNSMNRGREVEIKIGDFGLSEWENMKRSGDIIQTCKYRAPEAVLQAKYGFPVDIWSFGCIAYELATSTKLFPCKHDSDRENEAMEHIVEMAALFGPLEAAHYEGMSNKTMNTFFGRNGVATAKRAKRENLHWRCLEAFSTLSQNDAKLLSEFIFYILKLNPTERPSNAEILQHPFLSETGQ